MKELKIGDFKRQDALPGGMPHVFQHFTEDRREVCLESCMAGYCVGIYRNENLIGKKICTNMDMNYKSAMPGFSMMQGEVLVKAVGIANKMLS